MPKKKLSRELRELRENRGVKRNGKKRPGREYSKARRFFVVFAQLFFFVVYLSGCCCLRGIRVIRGKAVFLST